jgi:hypothetical protein
MNIVNTNLETNNLLSQEWLNIYDYFISLSNEEPNRLLSLNNNIYDHVNTLINKFYPNTSIDSNYRISYRELRLFLIKTLEIYKVNKIKFLQINISKQKRLHKINPHDNEKNIIFNEITILRANLDYIKTICDEIYRTLQFLEGEEFQETNFTKIFKRNKLNFESIINLNH